MIAMKSPLISTLALLLAAASAGAQSLPGFAHTGTAVTLAFNGHDDAAGDPYDENYTTQLTLRSTFAHGGGWSTTLTLGLNEETYQRSYYSDRLFLGIEPSYDFGKAMIGAYGQIGRHDISGEGGSDETSYGLLAAWDDGPWMAEAYFGRYEEDVVDYSAATAGVAAGYTFGNSLALYAFHRRDDDGSFWFGLTGIGVSFDLDRVIPAAPLTLTAEISRFHDSFVSFGDSDWDQVSLMATWRFGEPRRTIFRGIYNADYYYD